MWRREIEWIEPIEAAARLAGRPGLAWLDSAMPHPTLGRYSYIAADPFGVFTVRAGRAFWNGADEAAAPLAALRRRLGAFAIERRDDGWPPFAGGAIGCVGYDFGWSLEHRSSRVGTGGEDVHLAFHDIVLAFDAEQRRCWLLASGHPAPTPALRRERAQRRMDAFAEWLADTRPSRGAEVPSVDWRSERTREAYCADVERVKAYIRAGDIYQANIARRFTAHAPEGCDALALYRAVRAANPAPFAAFLDHGGRTILSTSPELFLRTDGRRVETRPIKGTARRAADTTRDLAAAARLAASRKDRAENVMIVDLLRNDLSRVCTAPSVEVPMLCGVESYAGLHHLVSSVTGELAPGRDAIDLLAATFPGGSITGAPKLRAMEIIAEIEGRPRGVYCGAIGWFGFDGAAELNIAIRTLVLDGTHLELRTGGGITLLSDPEAEYEETLVKARRIFGAFTPARALAEAGA